MLLSKLKITVGLALIAVLSLGFGIGGFSNSVSLTAAPVPREQTDPGVVWVYNWQTGKLLAYRPNGDKLKEYAFPKAEGNKFKGLTPDGSKFVFVQGQGNTLHTRPVGDETEATDLGVKCIDGYQVQWSPDGKRLFVGYFESEFADVVYTCGIYTEDGKKEHALKYKKMSPVCWADDKSLIMVTNHVAGVHPQYVKVVKAPLEAGETETLFDGEYLDLPQLSPDGKKILGFDNFRDGPDHKPNRGVQVYDLKTKETVDVARREKQGYGQGFWSMDGKRIAYRWCDVKPTKEDRLAGDWHFVVSDADGKNEVTLVSESMSNTVQSTQIYGWTSTPPVLRDAKPEGRKVTAPVPKEKPLEWKEAKPMELDGGRITGIAYSPDGALIAVVQDGGLTVVDAKTRKAGRLTPFGNEPTQRGVTFSPAGDYIAVTTKDGVAFVTPELEPKPDGSWTEKGSDPNSVLVLPDGRRVVASNGEYLLSNFGDPNGMANAATFEVKGFAVNKHRPVPLACLGDRHIVCSCDEGDKDDANALFLVATDNPVRGKWDRTKLAGHKSRPIAAVVSKDGKRIITADEGGTIIVREGEKFEEKSRVSIPGAVQIALAPDGTTVAVLRSFTDTTLFGTSGRTLLNLELFVFEVTDSPKDPKPLWSHRNILSDVKTFPGPASLAFSPDGKTLLGAFGDPYTSDKDTKSLGVRVWELGAKITAPIPKEKEVWKEAKPIQFESHPHGDRITGIDCSADGKFLAVAVGDQVRLLDAETRKQVNEHALTAKAPGTITGIAFSPKGDKLAMTAKDFVFINSKLGKSPSASSDSSWKCDGFDAHQVAWLSNDALVATNGSETRYRDAAGKEQAYTWLPDNQNRASILAPIPSKNAWLMQFDNGKKAPENPIWYWDADDNQRRYMLAGHKSRAIAAVVSKDGKRFLTLDGGGTIIVWEGDRFEVKSRVSIGGAVQIALAPDGKTLAVLRTSALSKLGPGGTATSFDLFVFDATDPPAKPKPIWTTANHIDGTFTGPASLVFSPDGRTLYGAFGDPYPVDPALNVEQKSLGVRVWELGTKIAAPVPKEKAEGRIWIADYSAKKLQAFKPDGTVEKEIAIPWHGQYLGLTPFGKIAVAGKKGKIVEEEKLEGLTLHLRALEEKAEAIDTGIPYSIGDGVLWSPDGKQLIRIRIVANNAAVNGSTQFTHSLIDVETKKEKELELPKFHRLTAWSPDGTWWLAVEAEGDSSRLHRVPVNGDKATRLSDDYRYYLTGSISPDGNSVAGFAAGKYNSETETTAFVVPSIGGKSEILSKNPKALSSNGTWSSDGKRIAFLTIEENEDAPRNKLSLKKLTICDADGSNAKVVKEWTQSEAGDTDFNRTLTCRWLAK